jgi:hypothetical protein
MVGQKVGIFFACEVKKPDWEYEGIELEVAQKKFIELMKLKGGRGLFANSVEQFRNYVLNK